MDACHGMVYNSLLRCCEKNLPKGGWKKQLMVWKSWKVRKSEGVLNCFNVLKMKTLQDTSTYPTYGKRANRHPIIFSTIPFLLLPMFLDSKPSEESMVPTILNHPSRRDHVGHNLFGTYKSEMKKKQELDEITARSRNEASNKFSERPLFFSYEIRTKTSILYQLAFFC